MLRANRDASYEAIPDPDDASAAARRHASLQAKIAQFNELQQRRRQLMLNQGDGVDEKDDVDGTEDGRDSSWIEVIEARDRVLSNTGEILPPGVFSPPSRKMRRGDRRRSTLSTISSDADDDSAMHRYSEYEPGPGVYTEPPSRQNEHIMMHPNLRSSFECLYDSGMEVNPPGVSSLERRGRSGSLLSGLRSLESLQGDWEAEELEARRWRDDDEGSTSTASAASFVRLPAQLRHQHAREAPIDDEQDEGTKTPQAVEEAIEETVTNSQEASVPQNHPDDRPIFPGEAPKRPKPRGRSTVEPERKRYARSTPQPPKRRSVNLDDNDVPNQQTVMEDIERPNFSRPNMLESRRSCDSLGDDLEALRRSVDEDEYLDDNRPKSPVTAPLQEPLAFDSNSPVSASSSSAFPFQPETKSPVPQTKGMRMSDRQAISKRPSLSELRQRFESLSQSSDTNENAPNQQKTDPLRRPLPPRSSQEHRSSLSSNDFGPKVELAPGTGGSKPLESRGSISSIDLSETPNSTLPKRNSLRIDSSLSSDDPNSIDASSLRRQSQGSGSRASEPRESPGLKRYEDKIRNQPGVAAFVQQLGAEPDPKLTRFHAWSNSHPSQEYIVNAASNETNINMSVPLRQPESKPESEMHRSSFQMMTTDDRNTQKPYDGDEDGFDDQILPARTVNDQRSPPGGAVNDYDAPVRSVANKSKIPLFNTRRGDPSQEDIVQQNWSQQQHDTPGPSLNMENSMSEFPPGRQASRIPRRKHGAAPPLPVRQQSLDKGTTNRESENVVNAGNDLPPNQQYSRLPTRQAHNPDAKQSIPNRPQAMNDDVGSSSDEYYGTPKSHKFPLNVTKGNRNDDPKRLNRRESQKGSRQPLGYNAEADNVQSSAKGFSVPHNEPEHGQVSDVNIGRSTEEGEPQAIRSQPIHDNRGTGYVLSLPNELKDPSLFESQENVLPHPVQRKSMKEQRDIFFGLNETTSNPVDEDNLVPDHMQKLQASAPQHGYGKEIYETSLDDIGNDEIPTRGLPDLPMVNPPRYVDAVRSSNVRNQQSIDSEGPPDQSSDYDTLQATWSTPTNPKMSSNSSFPHKGRQEFGDLKEVPSNSVEEFIDHVYRLKGSPDRQQRLPRRAYSNANNQFNDGLSSDSMNQASPERPPYIPRRVDTRGRSSGEPKNQMVPLLTSHSPPPEAFDGGMRRRRYDNQPVFQSDPHAPRREPGPPPRSHIGKDHGQNMDNPPSPPPPLPQRMKKLANDTSKVSGKFPRNPNSSVNQDPEHLVNYDPHRNPLDKSDQFRYDPRYPSASNHVPYDHQRNQGASKKSPSKAEQQHLQSDRSRGNNYPMNSLGEYPRTGDTAQDDRDRLGQGQNRAYPLIRREPYDEQTQSQFQYPDQYDLQPSDQFNQKHTSKARNGKPEQLNFRGPNQFNGRLPNQSTQQPRGRRHPSNQSGDRFGETDQSGEEFDISNPMGRGMMSRFAQDNEILPDHMNPQQSQMNPRLRGEQVPNESLSKRNQPSVGVSKEGYSTLPNDLIYPTNQRSENMVRPSQDRLPSGPKFTGPPSLDHPERRSSQHPNDAWNVPPTNYRIPDGTNNRNPDHYGPQYPNEFSHDPHSATNRSAPYHLSRSFDPKNPVEPEIPSHLQPLYSGNQNTGEPQYDNWNQPDILDPQSRFSRQHPIRRRDQIAPPKKKSSENSSRGEPTSVEQDFEFDPVTCQFIPRTFNGRPEERTSQLPRQQSNQPYYGDTARTGRNQNLVFDPIIGQFVPEDNREPMQSNQQHPGGFNVNATPSSTQREPNNSATNYQKSFNSQPHPMKHSAPIILHDGQQPNPQRPRHPSGHDSSTSQMREVSDPQKTGRYNQQYDPLHPGVFNPDTTQGRNQFSRYPDQKMDPRYNPNNKENTQNLRKSQPDEFWKQLPVSFNPAPSVQSGPSELQPDRSQNIQPEHQIPQEFAKGVSDQPMYPQDRSHPQNSQHPQSYSFPNSHSPDPRKLPRKPSNPRGDFNRYNEMQPVLPPQGQPSKGPPHRDDQIPNKYSQKYGQQPHSFPSSNQRDPRNESKRPDFPPNSSGWYPDTHPDRQGTQQSKNGAPSQFPYQQDNPRIARDNVQQPNSTSSHNLSQFGNTSKPWRPEERKARRISERSASPLNSDVRVGVKAQRSSPVPSSRPPLPPADDPTQFIDHKYLSLGRHPPHHQNVPEGPQYLSDIIVPSNARADQTEPPPHPGASYQLRSNPGARAQLVHSSRRDREGSTAQRATKPDTPEHVRRVQRASSEIKAAPPPLPPKIGGKIERSSSSVTSSRPDNLKTEEAAKLERLRATFEEAEKRLGGLGNRDEDPEERRDYFWRQMASLQKADFTWDDTDEWVTNAAKESPWAFLKDPGDLNDPVAELERMYLDLDLDREDLMERAERRMVPDSLYDRFVQLKAELPPPEVTKEAPPVLNHRLPSDSDEAVVTPSNCSTIQSNATSSRSVPHIPQRSPYPHKVRDDKAYRRLHPNVTAPIKSRTQLSISGSSTCRATPHGGTTPALSRRESDAGQHSSARSTLSRSHSLGRQSDVLAQPSPTSADYLLPRSSETIDQRKQWPPRYAEEPDPKLDDMAYRRLVRSSSSVKSNTHKPLLGKERPTPFTAFADTFASSIRPKPKTLRQTKLVAIRTRARIEETAERKGKSGGTTSPGCGRRNNLIQLVTWL